VGSWVNLRMRCQRNVHVAEVDSAESAMDKSRPFVCLIRACVIERINGHRLSAPVGAAIARDPWPTRTRDGQSAQPLSRRAEAAGGGDWLGSEFRATDHRRSGSQCSDISFREAPLLVGGRMPPRRRERESELQPPVSESNRNTRRTLNQSANAAVKAKGSIFEIVNRLYVPSMVKNRKCAQRFCLT
jgi:hypothetical protein